MSGTKWNGRDRREAKVLIMLDSGQLATYYLEVWLLSECNYVAFETGSA